MPSQEDLEVDYRLWLARSADVTRGGTSGPARAHHARRAAGGPAGSAAFGDYSAEFDKENGTIRPDIRRDGGRQYRHRQPKELRMARPAMHAWT